jgi:hypothetical protein
MIRKVLGRRRWGFAGLLAVALVALAVGIAQALAGTGTATVPLQKNNFLCGKDIGTNTFGSVTFTRDDKTTLREHVRLTKATPSTKYTVQLFSGGCHFRKTLGSLKTDSSGRGEARFTSSTLGNQSFFAFTRPEVCCGVSGDSTIAKVDG